MAKLRCQCREIRICRLRKPRVEVLATKLSIISDKSNGRIKKHDAPLTISKYTNSRLLPFPTTDQNVTLPCLQNHIAPESVWSRVCQNATLPCRQKCFTCFPCPFYLVRLPLHHQPVYRDSWLIREI